MNKPAFDLDDLKRNIRKVKLTLMTTPGTTFFAALLANLKLTITEDIKTASTNGVFIKFNPNFITPLTIHQLLGLMLHEVMHVVFNHILICVEHNLNHKVYNIAADHYINLYLLARGYELPPGGYHDPKYSNMSTMQIYNELMKNPPDDPDFDMDIDPNPENKDVDKEIYKQKVTSNIIKAVTQAELAKDYGSIPGGVLRRLEKILNSELPWETILQDRLTTYAKDDYSLRRPNRRYLPDFLLSSLYSESMGQLTAGVDVSISMNQKDLERIVAELRYIFDTMQPTKLRLMSFDVKVHNNEVYEEGDTLDDLKLHGGGGTNVQPLLDSLREEDPELALIFTDGGFATPNVEGIFSDVIWIINGNPGWAPPIGEAIHFN